VVDQLAGELQAVIKPLGPMFRNLRAVGGTTILGNGAVALILDIPRLAQIAVETSAERDLGRAIFFSNKPEVPSCN
jgi:two-component system chemotaxis sensor kinase CheA